MDIPKILREGEYNENDLRFFLHANRIWKMHDLYIKQKRELFEIQNATIIKSAYFIDQREKYIKKLNASVDLLGNWIYFPWNGVVVHTVTEQDYFLLCTNRNKDLVTADEQLKIYNTTIAIAGLSIGNCLASTLAYSGIGQRLKLAEYDNLQTTNLNRVQARIYDIGQSKIELTVRKIYEINPYLIISKYTEGINDHNINDFIFAEPLPKVIVDAVDDFSLKIKLREAAKKAKVVVLMFSNIGDRILVDIERYDHNSNTKLFNGCIDNVINTIRQNPDNNNFKKNNYAIQLVGQNIIPKRALKSVELIGKTLVGRPQLMSTVTISCGVAVYIIRKIILNDDIISGRYLIDLNDFFQTKK